MQKNLKKKHKKTLASLCKPANLLAMKLEKIELQTDDGYVLATLYIDVAWDVDEYAFQVEAVTVKGVSYPELIEAAEEWVAENEEYVIGNATEEAEGRRVAWEESR